MGRVSDLGWEGEVSVGAVWMRWEAWRKWAGFPRFGLWDCVS